eukprot:gene2894-3078_t
MGISLHNNNLRGSLPPVIANFPSLLVFSLGGNYLTGSLPVFTNCFQLGVITIGENSLTGTIPSNIIDKESLDKISNLVLHDNQLIGTIPDIIYALQGLNELNLAYNDLTGTLSSNLSQLTRLRQIDLSFNRLHGSIPSLTKLKNFHNFIIDGNFFSGHLLNDMVRGNMIFSVMDNNLEGPLPSQYNHSTYNQLRFSSNYLTGTIPSSICKMKNTNRLSLSDNILTGTVPECLWNFENLFLLELDYNEFHGPVSLLPIEKRSHTKDFLKYLSIGFNRFSGTFPSQWLQSSSLSAFSASSNCFTGGLPQNFSCSNISHDFRMLHIDSLYVSSHCKRPVHLWNKFETFGGQFPMCLLSSKIVEISATGNGFTGSIVFERTNRNYLNNFEQSLNLSYNYLTGTIPTALLEVPFSMLDLSYNKFRGRINHQWSATNVPRSLNTSLVLKKNRFSGNLRISTNASLLNRLEVLEGNIFARNSFIPHRDSFSDVYMCGSNSLDYSIYGFLTTTVIVIVLVISSAILFDLMHRGSSLTSLMDRVRIILSDANGFYSTKEIEFGLTASIIFLLVLLPVYISFNHFNNPLINAYEDIYHWVVSSVYLKGLQSAIIIIIVLLLMMLLFLFKFRDIVVIPEKDTTTTQTDTRLGSLIIGSYILIFILNATVSISINTFYVNVLNNKAKNEISISGEVEVILVQIGLALYNVIWNRYVLVFVLRYLRRVSKGLRLCGSREGWWEYEYGLMLLLMNSVIGPWLSVMLRDESCFEGLLYGRREVNQIIGTMECLNPTISNLKVCHRRSSFSLPFLYCNQCGSNIILNYLPLWVYYFAFSTGINIVSSFTLSVSQTLSQYLILHHQSFTDCEFVQLEYLFDLTIILCFSLHYPLLGIIISGKLITQCILSGLLLKDNHASSVALSVEIELPDRTLREVDEDPTDDASSEHGLISRQANEVMDHISPLSQKNSNRTKKVGK